MHPALLRCCAQTVEQSPHRLSRCASIITGEGGPLPRVKPFKYTYEKEIVMYAYYKKLDYFSTECVYAPFAARGFARDLVKDLEVGISFFHFVWKAMYAYRWCEDCMCACTVCGALLCTRPRKRSRGGHC